MRYAMLLTMGLLSGCSSIFGCDQKTETVDLIYKDTFYPANREMVDWYEGQGYDCQGEAIFKFGIQIGEKQTCTKC
jgi:uncharacterized protein YceK